MHICLPFIKNKEQGSLQWYTIRWPIAMATSMQSDIKAKLTSNLRAEAGTKVVSNPSTSKPAYCTFAEEPLDQW